MDGEIKNKQDGEIGNKPKAFAKLQTRQVQQFRAVCGCPLCGAEMATQWGDPRPLNALKAGGGIEAKCGEPACGAVFCVQAGLLSAAPAGPNRKQRRAAAKGLVSLK